MTELGITISVRASQLENALFGIEANELERVTLLRLSHLSKALEPIVVTEFGILRNFNYTPAICPS